MLEKLFGLSKAGTTVKTEIMAGVATFLTMAYITVVNPAILSTEGTGMAFGAVFTATIIAAVVGTLIMGLWAKWPVALAPGMGLNAFFTFGVIFGMGTLIVKHWRLCLWQDLCSCYCQSHQQDDTSSIQFHVQ